MVIDIVIIGLLVFTLLVLKVLYSKMDSLDSSSVAEKVLGRVNTDLAVKIVESAGDTKQAVTQKISSEFLQAWQKMGDQLDKNRQDQETRLSNVSASMEKKLEDIRGTVDARLLAIGKQVQDRLDKSLDENFKHYEQGQKALADLQKQLLSLNTMGGSINELNLLLKQPHLRGSFGEMELEDLLADFLPVTMYEIQKQASRGARPDARINFPNGYLAIDSKFPREQVLPLFELSGPEALEKARSELSRVLKAEAKDIHDKYIRPDEGSMDMALMFLPSETLYFEVIRNVDLSEQLSKLKVFPVSPNTLAVTLKAISIAHNYYQMAKNVESTIDEIKKARKHFENFDARFEKVGEGLRKAQEAFDTASTHLGRYSGAVARLAGQEPAELELDSGEISSDNKSLL